MTSSFSSPQQGRAEQSRGNSGKQVGQGRGGIAEGGGGDGGNDEGSFTPPPAVTSVGRSDQTPPPPLVSLSLHGSPQGSSVQ